MNLLRRVALPLMVLAALSAGSVLVWAMNPSMPPSLYKPELKRELTQEMRWKLDFDLANEASMKDHNSRRFEAPGSFEKRALWFEATAQWYPIADLMQQFINFRTSKMVNNEKAFNALVALGQQGDIGASCMAWMFYQHFNKEDTAKWRYSYDDVARTALALKDSGHPVCSNVEGSLYLYGGLGYERSASKARPFMIGGALTGFYGSQEYMANTHLLEGLHFVRREFELNLCWKRLADSQSSVAGYESICQYHREGLGFNDKLKLVTLPTAVQEIARRWCEPNRLVTAQTCADLEYTNEGK